MKKNETISGTSGTTTITGSGTSFLAELSPEDVIIYETTLQTYKWTVKSVESDTSLTTVEALDLTVGGISVVIEPIRPYRLKNRNWHIAGHKLRAPSTTVSAAVDIIRFEVNDVSDFFLSQT